MEIKKLVKEMLQSGAIRPSISSLSSPLILVRKKDGIWRFCVDYKTLNQTTILNHFPIPTVDEIHKARSFSKLDLRLSHRQIRIAEINIYKTTFRTHEGTL